MKKAIFGVWFVGLLLILNGLVYQKETMLKEAQQVLLALAPVDPRSLIQGDFMVLRYAIANEVTNTVEGRDGQEGLLTLKLESNGVASLVAIDSSAPLEPGQIHLKYRINGGRCLLGAESYMFEEGRADHFAAAKFGELRVSLDGSSVLVGLRNEGLEPL